MDSTPRNREEIVASLGPAKSNAIYEKEWSKFKSFARSTPPTEDDFLSYFDHLRRTKGYKSSTMWSLYSMINFKYKLETGHKLQDHPVVTQLLKSYEHNYERKVAKIFTLDEIKTLLSKELPSPFWVVRKCIIALAFCGGLRCKELRDLKFGSLTHTDKGYIVIFQRAKQTGEQAYSNFLVPYSANPGEVCFASKVEAYLNSVTATLGEPAPTDDLFKGTKGGKGIARQPMGINLIRNVGCDVAKELNLTDVKAYTGHCWRRSSATQLAGSGATSTDLKRTFGWKQETTAMRYIDHSVHQTSRMAEMLTETTPKRSKMDDEISVGRDSFSGPPSDAGDKAKVFHITVESGATLNIS